MPLRSECSGRPENTTAVLKVKQLSGIDWHRHKDEGVRCLRPGSVLPLDTAVYVTNTCFAGVRVIVGARAGSESVQLRDACGDDLIVFRKSPSSRNIRTVKLPSQRSFRYLDYKTTVGWLSIISSLCASISLPRRVVVSSRSCAMMRVPQIS